MFFVEPYRHKTIVITGASGYIGHNLTSALSAVPCKIVRLLRRGKDSGAIALHCKAQIDDIACDISDRIIWERVLDGADYLFHLAAQTSVYTAERDALADRHVNVTPMETLLEVCKEKKYSPVIIFAGTATEAGIQEKMPVDETVLDRPVTVYDTHKLMAEKHLLASVANGIVKGCALRLTNVYGPGRVSASKDRGILNQMVRKALAQEPLAVYGNGEYLRDYIFIDDVLRAFLAAGANIGQTTGNYFVIGSGVGHCVGEMVALVAEKVGAKTGSVVKVSNIEMPKDLSPIEFRNFVAKATLFTEKTQWIPRVSLREGIDLTIAGFA